MDSNGIHKTIKEIISFFFRLGLWHREEQPSPAETRLKLFYSIFYSLFPISLLIGAIISDDRDDKIFLLESAITTTVMTLRLYFIIWKKKQILELLNCICASSIDDRKEFTEINDKLTNFMKFIHALISSFLFTAISVTILPFLGDEKKLFFNIGFPFDWRNSEFGFWLAFTFITVEVILSCVAFLFPVITWYLMLYCALKYEILGKQMLNMGTSRQIEGERKKHINYRRDLTAAIKCYSDTRKY